MIDRGRRRLLAGLGLAGAVGVAGCVGGDENGNGEEGTGNGDDGNDEENGNGEAGELHPRYGYASTSMDEEQPVEHDHTVRLLMESQEVGPPVFYFEPAGIAVEQGDVIRFEFRSPDHSVAAFHKGFGRTHRAPEDAESVSSPMMEIGTYWLCEFVETGVWDLYCPPHEFVGMGMRVVVEEATGPATEPADPDPDPEDVDQEGFARPPEQELAETFNAEALDPENILEQGEVPWEDVADREEAE